MGSGLKAHLKVANQRFPLHTCVFDELEHQEGKNRGYGPWIGKNIMDMHIYVHVLLECSFGSLIDNRIIELLLRFCKFYMNVTM